MYGRRTTRLVTTIVCAAAIARTTTADDESTPPATATSGAVETAAPAATPNRADNPRLRRREGAKLAAKSGRFERRGERYVFLADGDAAHYLVLENLMLERVANMLADASGGQLQWSVDGTTTEFRGANYLLLHRAVVKSTPDGNEPRRLGDPLAEAPRPTTK
jgi:hypothetical protein